MSYLSCLNRIGQRTRDPQPSRKMINVGLVELGEELEARKALDAFTVLTGRWEFVGESDWVSV